MRFIYSLAFAQLCVVVISQDINLNEFKACEQGLWQCGVGQQCVACYKLSTGYRINSYCNDPTDRMSQSLCGLVDRTVRCDECGATNNGLDAKTGLEYINNGDACQKDADCGSGGLCASCKFEAFQSNTPDWFNFCYTNGSKDPKKQYCNQKRHKGACVCGDNARKAQQFIAPEAMLDLNGQDQNGFAHVSEEQAVLPLIDDFEVAGNGFAVNEYPPFFGQGENKQFPDWNVENFPID